MGAAAAWMVIEPPSISLPPGGEAAATIRFNPPRSPEVLPGETPFAVQVVSREDPDGSVAGEGTIVVGRYDQRIITLTPPGNVGRRVGRFELTIDNRGNFPFRVSLTGPTPSTPVASCSIRRSPTSVPARHGPSDSRSSPRSSGAGLPRTHQFQVQAIEDEQEPDVLTATFIQQESLPTWVLRALLAAALVIVLAVVGWFALVKPAVEDTARDTIAGPLASMNSRVDEVLETTTTPARADHHPRRVRHHASAHRPTSSCPAWCRSGTSQTFSKSFDKDFALTDFVVQNPDGATGTVQIMRDDEVLNVNALENIRDNAQHLVRPVRVQGRRHARAQGGVHRPGRLRSHRAARSTARTPASSSDMSRTGAPAASRRPRRHGCGRGGVGHGRARRARRRRQPGGRRRWSQIDPAGRARRSPWTRAARRCRTTAQSPLRLDRGGRVVRQPFVRDVIQRPDSPGAADSPAWSATPPRRSAATAARVAFWGSTDRQRSVDVHVDVHVVATPSSVPGRARSRLYCRPLRRTADTAGRCRAVTGLGRRRGDRRPPALSRDGAVRRLCGVAAGAPGAMARRA